MAAAYKGLRFAIASVKEFAAFEMGLANVSTMLDDASMKYMPAYEKQIKKMAREFGQSTDTLSKGLYDILSASIGAEKAIKVLRVSSKAAIAGLTDTGTAADALTTILNSYGLEAKEAAKIGDILFATVKAGKITFGELAGSIGKVSSLAAAVGLDFTQVSAAISTMTRAGVQSDIAMTALKAILTAFLKPQSDAIKVASKFGLVLNAATLDTIGLTGVMEKLKTATNEEVAAIFPNVRALTGVAALRGNLTGLINDQEKALHSLGMQEKAYHKIADTTGTKLKMLAEDWKAMKVASGEFFLKIPGFVTEAGKLLEVLDELREVREAFEKPGKKPQDPTYGFMPTPPIAKRPKEELEEWEGSYGVFRKLEDGIVRVDKVLDLYVSSSVAAGEATGRATIGIKAYERAGLPIPAILLEIAAAEKQLAEETKKANEERLAGIRIFNEQTAAYQKDILGGEDYREPISTEADIAAIKDLNELVLSQHDYELFLLDDRIEAYREAGVEEYLIEKIKNAKIAKLNEGDAEEKQKYLDDQANAYRRLYDDLGQMGKTNFDYMLQLLDKEKEIYAAFIKDKALLDEWYAARKRELDNKQAIESDDVVAGFGAGIDKMREEMKTFGEFSAETAGIMKSSMSDYFMTIGQEGSNWKDAMEGFFLSVGQSFQRMIADMVAQQMMQSIMQPLLGIGVSALTGGIGGLFAGGAGTTFENPMAVMGVPSAKGNIFSNGSVVPFGKGGILDRPTIFPMSNGGIALGGEAGREAFMPLGRDSQGRLSVHTDSKSEDEKQPIKIINVMDFSQVQEFLNTGDGERQIVNIMRRNSNEIQEVAG